MALSCFAGFFAAMGKTGGGRNELDPRFISKLSIFNVTAPCDETVRHIYRSILAGHTGNFAEEIRTIVPVIVEATLCLYKVRHTTACSVMSVGEGWTPWHCYLMYTRYSQTSEQYTFWTLWHKTIWSSVENTKLYRIYTIEQLERDWDR